MTNNFDKKKNVSALDMETVEYQAKKPFEVVHEERRRFIRLEISSPIDINRVKDIFGNYASVDDQSAIVATILDISVGGLLVEIKERLNEGDIVSMNFTLQGAETTEDILGLVKRTDNEDDFQLAGIAFTEKCELVDLLSTAELDMLGDSYTGFTDSVKQVLQRYVYQNATS